jgi:DNA processing protein
MDGQTRSGSRHEEEQAIIYGRPVLMWAPALAASRGGNSW